MRVLPCGDRAVLVELDGLPEVLGLCAALRADPPPGTGEVVPAARTVLIRYDPARTGPERLAGELRRSGTGRADQRAAPLVRIPVRYDGDDLDEVARLTGLTPRAVAARHQAGTYTAAFSGFAPGFAYLTGLDPALRVPRRATPRTRVPPGSVALAAEFTAVYPRRSPGGWHVIGHTDLTVWDLDRDPPMTLVPGSRVRFVQADA